MTLHDGRDHPARIFHGWFVVAAAFAVTFLGFGSAYTFSAFVGSLQRDFAASRGSVSLVDYFGGRNVSGIIGVLYTSVAFGTLIGPTAAGFAFDLSHSYMLPILAGAGANVVSAGIMAGMPEPPVSAARDARAGPGFSRAAKAAHSP